MNLGVFFKLILTATVIGSCFPALANKSVSRETIFKMPARDISAYIKRWYDLEAKGECTVTRKGKPVLPCKIKGIHRKSGLSYELTLTKNSYSEIENYSCAGKSNPDRGFNTEFAIKIPHVAVGGKLVLEAMGKSIEIGEVSSIELIRREEASEARAFNLILSMFGPEDVSGLSAERLNDVVSIRAIKVEHPKSGDDETIVYKLLSQSGQIGGIFMSSAMATSCLPK